MTLIDSEVAALILDVDPRQVRRFVEQGKLLNLGDARAMRFEVDEVSELARTRNAAKREQARECENMKTPGTCENRPGG